MGVIAVATGTVIDHNDGKPVYASISASLGQSQVYNKDESTIAWLPNYVSTPNRLSAIVTVGGADVVSVLSAKKWGTAAGLSDLGTGSYIDVATNQDPGVATQRTYFFEATYTDPVTLLPTLVKSQITLSVLKTGTNAVYVLISGQRIIKKAADGSRNMAELTANLVRASGMDTTGLTYKWFKSPYTVNDQLDAAHADVTGGKISFKNAAGLAGTNPADNTWGTDIPTIIIREDAVANVGMYKVQIKDADAIVFEQIFEIADVADIYFFRAKELDGNVLLNGLGTLRLIPQGFYGDTEINTVNYTYRWWAQDRNGNKSGYIDTARSPAARTISAHTTGAGTVFTINSGTIPVAGDAIRVISADGLTIRSFEVASATATSITIRAPVNGFSADYPSLTTTYVGGKLWIYANNGANAGSKATAGTEIFTITQDDMDGKLGWSFEATNPLAV
ncbi:MAG: hypothetical protein ACYC2S_09810 [Spirochaetales bacterium]